jgi:hypothetical protein
MYSKDTFYYLLFMVLLEKVCHHKKMLFYLIKGIQFLPYISSSSIILIKTATDSKAEQCNRISLQIITKIKSLWLTLQYGGQKTLQYGGQKRQSLWQTKDF